MIKVNFEGDDGICCSVNRLLSRYYANNLDFKNSIRQNYLWFSDPLDFNDPYDCNMVTGIDSTFEEIFDYLLRENQKHDFGVTDSNLRIRAKQLFDNPSERKKLSIESDLDTVSKLGICCFSQKMDSLLMWSHYGDKHRGVCLTFDIMADSELFSSIYSLEYPLLYPKYNWPKDQDKFHSLRFLIATKSKEWEYEDEIRVVKDRHNTPFFRGKVRFDKKALVSVSFGYNCTLYDINEIKQVLDDSKDINMLSSIRLF